jgi:hypothetical protein
MASYLEHSMSSTDFEKTINDKLYDTLNFEEHSIAELYANRKIKHYEKSELSLHYYRNVIIEKYGQKLQEEAKLIAVEREDARRFEYNPYLFSYENLGSPDYWWLVLYVNKCLSIHEFKNFQDYILLPDLGSLKKSLIYELKNNPDIGTVQF